MNDVVREQDDGDGDKGPLTPQYVKKVIKVLKTNKRSGEDGTRAESLKYVRSKALGMVKRSLDVLFIKRANSLNSRTTRYTGISLVNTVYKVLAICIKKGWRKQWRR